MSEPVEQTLPKAALVLDDEAQIGTMVCKVLSLIGIAAQHFTDPIAFLIEIKRSQPQLVILDLRAPMPAIMRIVVVSIMNSSFGFDCVL